VKANHYNDDYDDDLLRRHYEKELEILRRDMRLFAQRHPQAAARLSINSDGRSEDPSIERMTQSAALLHARHSAKIDDDFPELSEALIERTYPQYLRPFPSCSVAQFDTGGVIESLTQSVRIPRGTLLETNAGRCTFRTAYDVVLAPVQIVRAQYSATSIAPPGVKVPLDANGKVSMTFRLPERGGRFDVTTLGPLRVHLAGPATVVAALFDTLLLRTTRAYVEDGEGRWTRLADLPVKAVGFDADDWLFTNSSEPGQAFGLLGEYFAFAQRFHFVDIDFASLRTATSGDEFTLHLVQTGVPPSPRVAQQLAHFSADDLKLFCTPVVNLFERKAVSLKYHPQSGTWPIEVQQKNDAYTEVWSVDRVCTPQGTTLPSSAALVSNYTRDAPPMWTLLQGKRTGTPDAPRTAALGLGGHNGVNGEAAIDTLLIELTCSNGDLPRSVALCTPDGDVRMLTKARAGKKIALLYAPTAVGHLSRTDGGLWRFIGQQSAHVIGLNQAGLPAFKQLLQQFAALSRAQARHIDGIRGLRHRLVMTLMARKPQPAMVRRIEITLQIDEESFLANSIVIFARVMERFFAPYVHTNSFIQLLVVSANGVDLWRGEPVRGSRGLL